MSVERYDFEKKDKRRTSNLEQENDLFTHEGYVPNKVYVTYYIYRSSDGHEIRAVSNISSDISNVTKFVFYILIYLYKLYIAVYVIHFNPVPDLVIQS